MIIIIPITITILLVILFLILFWRYYYFFRDPHRNIPQGNTIVSPADGKIVYIKEVKKGTVPLCIKKNTEILLDDLTKETMPKEDYYLIGIFMNPFNVHVNRAPIEGEIIYTHHHKNKNLGMTPMLMTTLFNKHPYELGSDHVLTNERKTTLIKNKRFFAYVVQIADKNINKIVNFKAKGETVEKGERIGLIRMGSQVDLIIPKKDITIKCELGANVHAGSSILAEYK